MSALLTAGVVYAQPSEVEPQAEPGTTWGSTLDLGLAFTDGNSEIQTFNVKGSAERRTRRSNFKLKLDGLQSNTADDRFRTVDPGFSWLVGDPPPSDLTTSLVDPDTEPDVEKYSFEARYDRSIAREPRIGPGSQRWHVGVSWDRNLDAGLVGRTTLFAGLGHDWWDRDDLRFSNYYSVSWTQRDETTPDPEKEERFPGVRYGWLFENKWGRFVTYGNDGSLNVNLGELSDYTASMTHSIKLPMSERLSLRVSMQLLYSSVPALEDLDVVALVDLVDPDGMPGTGDEFFRTVEAGGVTIDVGSVRERKEQLDTVFTTSVTFQF